MNARAVGHSDLLLAVEALAAVVRGEYPEPHDLADYEARLENVAFIYSRPSDEQLAALRRVERRYPHLGDWS